MNSQIKKLIHERQIDKQKNKIESLMLIYNQLIDGLDELNYKKFPKDEFKKLIYQLNIISDKLESMEQEILKLNYQLIKINDKNPKLNLYFSNKQIKKKEKYEKNMKFIKKMSPILLYFFLNEKKI